MISAEDIKKLANLARIKLVPGDEVKLAKDMDNILGYVNQIQQVSGTRSTEKEKVRNVLRDDSNPHESGINTEALLAEAPKREGQYVKVKKIL
jgi:aspartyl-tRNA(Asn)/glutamyl-tRNA(Gln) amidotransferase subunit C